MIQNGLEREKNHLSRETCLTIIQPDVFIGVFERSNKDCGDIIKYHDYVSRIPTELILRKVHFQRTNIIASVSPTMKLLYLSIL